MTDLTAQARTGSNDTVHLYDGTVETKRHVVTGDTSEVEPALCSGAPLYQPTKNDAETEYSVTVEEVEDEDYLVRDGEVIGKFCGNCANIATGQNFGDS